MDDTERNGDEAGRKSKAVPHDYELIEACSKHDVEKVKDLLSQGANPNARSFSSSGAPEEYPEWSTEYSSTPALIIAFPSVEIVRLLLEAGADPNCASEQKLERGEYGTSARSLAASMARSNPDDPRYSEIAEMLNRPGGRWGLDGWALWEKVDDGEDPAK